MLIDAIYDCQADKVMFLKGLIRVSKVEGELSEEEILFLHNVAVGIGVSEKNIKILETAVGYELDSEIGKKFFELSFDSKKKSIFFLEEAIQLCYIDDVYHEKEQNEIRVIANEVGISLDTVIAIEQWGLEGIKWKERGESLLSLEE